MNKTGVNGISPHPGESARPFSAKCGRAHGTGSVFFSRSQKVWNAVTQFRVSKEGSTKKVIRRVWVTCKTEAEAEMVTEGIAGLTYEAARDKANEFRRLFRGRKSAVDGPTGRRGLSAEERFRKLAMIRQVPGVWGALLVAIAENHPAFKRAEGRPQRVLPPERYLAMAVLHHVAGIDLKGVAQVMGVDVANACRSLQFVAKAMSSSSEFLNKFKRTVRVDHEWASRLLVALRESVEVIPEELLPEVTKLRCDVQVMRSNTALLKAVRSQIANKMKGA